jgi:hypothetical protein
MSKNIFLGFAAVLPYICRATEVIQDRSWSQDVLFDGAAEFVDDDTTEEDSSDGLVPKRLVLAEGNSTLSMSDEPVIDSSDVDEVVREIDEGAIDGSEVESNQVTTPPPPALHVRQDPSLRSPQGQATSKPRPTVREPAAVQPRSTFAMAARTQPAAMPRLRGQPLAPAFGGLPETIVHGDNASSETIVSVPVIVLGDNASSSLEDQVQDLFKLGAVRESMDKASFEATPFGGSIEKIKKLIEDTMMPKILMAHQESQKQLVRLAKDLSKCGADKKEAIGKANVKKAMYLRMSPLHKTCRAGEAGLSAERTTCKEELRDKAKIRDLRCKEFAMVKQKYGDQQANRAMVSKAGSESVESYVNRITQTVCGAITCSEKHAKEGGCGRGGMKDIFDRSKRKCERATEEYNAQLKKCKRINKDHNNKIKECDSIQDQMDGAACKRAVDMKDACEAYAECYFNKKEAYMSFHKMSKKEETDRKAEWRGLKRMQCLITAFADGKVKQSEVSECKKKTHSTKHLTLSYPKLPALVKCTVPNLYPATPAYKKREFAPLPSLAKGRDDANECTGVQEIATKPAKGSPKSCKCRQVTLNGPYSAGPLVKCTRCWDVHRSLEKNSCPDGTKLFAPRTRMDWKTIISSVTPIRAPHWIVDITRSEDGCGGCTKPMNSHTPDQKSWLTSDGSPWWLRSTRGNAPTRDYLANCYLDIFQAKTSNQVTVRSRKCAYHAHSYFCQNEDMSVTPKKGSPRSCVCKKVVLTGKYSAGSLLKCVGCLRVSKALQKNSCPKGTKIFSPRTRQDWRTFIASAKPLRSPNFIIDVTRPQNGCGGCTRTAMNSKSPSQATWRTSDGSPWWLRSTKYTEPNGDYFANCYMDLWHNTATENSVAFNDKKCAYHSNAYYCQQAVVRKKRRKN